MDTFILVLKLFGGACLTYMLAEWGIQLWRGKIVADPRLLAAILLIYSLCAAVNTLDALAKILGKMMGVS